MTQQKPIHDFVREYAHLTEDDLLSLLEEHYSSKEIEEFAGDMLSLLEPRNVADQKSSNPQNKDPK